MVYGSAVLNPRVVGQARRWAHRRWRHSRLESGATTATGRVPSAVGARMDEGDIRRCVARARNGEREAVGELFDAFRSDVMKLSARLVGPIDAEDAASEVFERAQQKLESYDAAQPFRRWLLSIASHHCIDRLRRRNVEKRLFDPGVSEPDDLAIATTTALDAIVRAQQTAAVQDAIDRLPDRYRAPLVLRYFLELDYDAIGEELGIKRSQVASLLFRGKQELRTLLRDEREDRP